MPRPKKTCESLSTRKSFTSSILGSINDITSLKSKLLDVVRIEHCCTSGNIELEIEYYTVCL